MAICIIIRANSFQDMDSKWFKIPWVFKERTGKQVSWGQMLTG
jgi:hypothetical protein